MPMKSSVLCPNSRAVIECAIRILSRQSFVPRSPAEYTPDGDVNLCLAGAVAKAGFLVGDRVEEARQFEKDLAATKSKDRLRAAFIRLGWSAADCNIRLECNDAAPDWRRKAEVLNYLQRQYF